MKFRYLSLLLSGAFLGLSFPKAGFALFAWFGVAPLLLLVWNVERKEAFRFGLVHGLGFYLTTLYWIDNSIRVYGHVPFPLSVLPVILLSLYMALFTGGFAALFNHLYRKTVYPALLLAPVLWVSLDILRTYLFTGFPWASLGYSQYEWLPVIQIADMTGVYGVTFLLLSVNGAIADVLVLRKRMRRHPLFPALPTYAGLIAVVMLVLCTLWYGFYRMRHGAPISEPLTVSIIQGNIDQGEKWSPENEARIIKTYQDLTQASLNRHPDLVIWPETAVPFVYASDLKKTAELSSFVRSTGTPLLFGVVTPKSGEEERGEKGEG